jgi:hypothetical protein
MVLWPNFYISWWNTFSKLLRAVNHWNGNLKDTQKCDYIHFHTNSTRNFGFVQIFLEIFSNRNCKEFLLTRKLIIYDAFGKLE